MSYPNVTLRRTGVARLAAGHPWIYRGHLEPAGLPDRPGVVRLLDERRRPLGIGLFSPQSQISVRFLDREEKPVGVPFFVDRLTKARDYRDRVLGSRGARREVFSESDGLPSLVVDRYGDHLVVQVLSAGLEALAPALRSALAEVYQPASILARNDASVRGLEGLERAVEQWSGTTPPRLDMIEGDLVFEVDPWKGQKTGAFLDQAENHAAAAALARGTALDTFTCNGGFALALARRGAQVKAIDSSGEALEAARRNAARNGLADVTFVEANVFNSLKSADQAGERYDMVVLDPPAFARNRNEVEGGLRGYKEINLRGMKLLNPGGFLVTCSCSYHVTEDLFLDVLSAAATDVRRRFRLVDRRSQARDHPLLVGFPESYYLKCLILQRLD